MKARFVPCLVVAMALPFPASVLRAQTPPQEAAVLPDTATLRLNNRFVIQFRTSLGATSSSERVRSAAGRLAAALTATDADSVSTRAIAEGTLVLIGSRPAFSIVPGDVDQAAGETLPALVASTTSRLTEALESGRGERTLGHLALAIGMAALATLAFLFGLAGIRWVRRRILDRLPQSIATLPELRVSGFTVLGADSSLVVIRRAVGLLAWSVGLFAAYLWLAFVLTRFWYSRPWGEALGGYLASTIRNLATSAVAGVPGLFTAALIFIVARWVVRLIGAFFDSVEAGSVDVPWVHPETANPTKRIAIALAWLFAVVIAYPYLPGSGSDVFKGISVFAGLVLSLGSSSLVSQGMSGLVLMYARALKPGDYVRIGDIEGTVTTLGMLSTKIQTLKLEEVTIPNTVVVGTNIRNFSRLAGPKGILLHTSVTIGYDVPWRQVEAMLLIAAGRTPAFRADPRPFVLKTALSDYYVEYELNAYLDAPDRRVRVLSELHAHIVDVFNEHGVQILSPHFVADPSSPAIVPRDRWFAAPATRPRTEVEPDR